MYACVDGKMDFAVLRTAPYMRFRGLLAGRRDPCALPFLLVPWPGTSGGKVRSLVNIKMDPSRWVVSAPRLRTVEWQSFSKWYSTSASSSLDVSFCLCAVPFILEKLRCVMAPSGKSCDSLVLPIQDGNHHGTTRVPRLAHRSTGRFNS